MVTSLSSSATSLCIFHSAPWLHCNVSLCVPFRYFRGTSITHRGHRGWGRFPSFKYHHSVPDVPVPEVHPNLSPRKHLATTPFDWAGPSSFPSSKRQYVGSWVVAPVSSVYLTSLNYLTAFEIGRASNAVRYYIPNCVPISNAVR